MRVIPLEVLTARLERAAQRGERLPNGCLIWPAAASRGYGAVTIWRRGFRLHRLSLIVSTGEDRPGQDARHACDTPRCFEGTHLIWGTRRQNMKDARERGRLAVGDRHGSRTHPERVPRGERHWGAKLNEQSVRAIRARRSLGEPLKALAAEFGVSQATISLVARGKHWRAA